MNNIVMYARNKTTFIPRKQIIIVTKTIIMKEEYKGIAKKNHIANLNNLKYRNFPHIISASLIPRLSPDRPSFEVMCVGEHEVVA